MGILGALGTCLKLEDLKTPEKVGGEEALIPLKNEAKIKIKQTQGKREVRGVIEKEALVEKEAEISPSLNYYEAIISLNRERNRRMAQGRKVIKGKLIPWEQNRQGMVRWYCNDIIDDTADARWNLFVHEIGVHSGKHIHQGGANLFVLKGKGYTIVDGIRFDWAEGDLILLPIKKHGVEHQHFNIDGRPSRWVAFGNNRIKEFAGRFLEQRVESPDWIKMKNKGGF